LELEARKSKRKGGDVLVQHARGNAVVRNLEEIIGDDGKTLPAI
jgi:hypothetical protein